MIRQTYWLVAVMILTLSVFERDLAASSATSSAEEKSVDSLLNIGWVFRNTYPDSTIHFVSKALVLAEARGVKHQVLQSYNFLGVGHRNLGNYSKAFEYYMAAYSKSIEWQETEQTGYSLINLGNLSIYQTDYEGALPYFLEALQTSHVLNDTVMTAYCYINLGRAYRNLSRYDLAEENFLKSLEIRQRLNDLDGIIAVEADLGEVYRLRGDYDQALIWFERALGRSREVNNLASVVYSLNNVALTLLDMSEPELAEKYAKESLLIAQETGLQNDVRRALLSLSKAKEASGVFDQALTYHQDYHDLNQQIFSDENTRKIERLRAQYEGEKKEAENVFLKEQAELNSQIISTQKTLIWLTGIGIILLMIIALVSFWAYRTKTRLSNKIMGQKLRIEEDKAVIEQQSQKLEEIDRAKSRFFANISHDLRSPLSLIMGNLENIKYASENYLTPKSKNDLEVIERNSRRLLNMTDEISDLTKLEEGKMKLNIRPISLQPYLEQLLNMFETTASLKHVTLKLSSDNAKTYVVEIDPTQFEKVIFNIVGNALKHTQQEDRITVNLKKNNGQVVLEISDTGEGIKSESIPHIFDRFYQSPDKTYHAREGLGIGLALVKELVELHEGLIEVSSELGKGTTFRVTLPESNEVPEGELQNLGESIAKRSELLTILEQEDFNAKERLDLTGNGQKSAKVLVVEDHAEIRNYIRDLINEDFSVLEAANGKEALEALNRSAVDLIITDLMMPWMDGFELLEALGKNDRLKTIPVLVVSARASEEDREKVLFHGVNDFLQKPFNKNELKLRVQNLLAKKTKWEEDKRESAIREMADQVDSMERGLLRKIDRLILDHIDDSGLNIAQLADTMAASERQVYRIVKKVANKTPLEYIKEVRLQFADQLIRQGKVKTASQAAREIGMKNVTQFNKIYENRFGKKAVEVLD